MYSLTPSPAPLPFVLPSTPLYPFFPSSPTPCRPFSTAQPRRRALSAYFVSFSGIFFAKSKIYSHKPKMYPANKHVDSPIQINLGAEPVVYTLYPFQTFFSQKAKYIVTNQKCIPANKHVDSPIQINLGAEPVVYILYPFQTFFSQKTKERATNQKCTLHLYL
jgi:hypothetical protein